MTHPPRSMLFMPADNARAVEKARALPCDAVVLDLEDAVGPERKDDARRDAVQAATAGGFGPAVMIRVNGLDTPWGAEDLAAVARSGVVAMIAPKVDDAASARAYLDALGPGGPPLWVMIETCKGVLNVSEIASTPGVAALVFGANDLSADMRCRVDAARTALQPALALTVAAARAHGLMAIDGVFNKLEDAEGLAAECAQGRDFGFDGKNLIHPNQIEAANAAFSPSAAEIAWAQAVIEAFAPGVSQGAIRVNGKMVERLHLDRAHAILEAATRL